VWLTIFKRLEILENPITDEDVSKGRATPEDLELYLKEKEKIEESIQNTKNMLLAKERT